MVSGEINNKLILCIKLAGVPGVAQVYLNSFLLPFFTRAWYFDAAIHSIQMQSFLKFLQKNCRLFLKMHQYSNRKIHKKMRNLRFKYGDLHAGFKVKIFKGGTELTTNLRLLYGGRRFYQYIKDDFRFKF